MSCAILKSVAIEEVKIKNQLYSSSNYSLDKNFGLKSSEEKLVVALDASKEITRHALEWALNNIAQPGDKITVLALLPVNYSSKSGTGWKLWTLPRMAGECTVYDGFLSSQQRRKEARKSCAYMMQSLQKLCTSKKVTMTLKIIHRDLPGEIAAEAKRYRASWVVLDRHLRKESRRCLVELKCNIVVVNKLSPKILRLNLHQSLPGKELPFADESVLSLRDPDQRSRLASTISEEADLDASPSSLTSNSDQEFQTFEGPRYEISKNSHTQAGSQNNTWNGNHNHPYDSAELSSPDQGHSLSLNSSIMRLNASNITAFLNENVGRDDTRIMRRSKGAPRQLFADLLSGKGNGSRELKFYTRSSSRKKSHHEESSEDIDRRKNNHMSKEKSPKFAGNQVDEDEYKEQSDEDNTVSSIRKAISLSRSSPAGPPPLCSICQHKSPVFGKPPRRFTYAELEFATAGFSKSNFLAEGGFGSVHRGVLPDGQAVAVKQHRAASSQGDKEFCSEVEVLSCAQHRNVVMLIGYCVELGKRLLVYEFVCNGSLDSHLYGRNHPPLPWSSRQKIAIGAARGVRYLHEECRVGCIVHRDMRPNNILLTHDFEPMVGDFGLARWQPDGDLGVETRVIGTFGYLAPEYAQSGQITEKADVYSFGVVLLELVTGLKAIDGGRPKGQCCLSEWARPFLDTNTYHGFIDNRLEGQFVDSEVCSMLQAASLCIRRDPKSRPRMSQVLRILEGDTVIDTSSPSVQASSVQFSSDAPSSSASPSGEASLSSNSSRISTDHNVSSPLSPALISYSRKLSKELVARHFTPAPSAQNSKLSLEDLKEAYKHATARHHTTQLEQG